MDLPVATYTLASGGRFTWMPGYSAEQMVAFAAAKVEEERERCAKVCEWIGKIGPESRGAAFACAAEIRHGELPKGALT